MHVKRIRPALKWIRALLAGTPGPLERCFFAVPENADLEIVTDASPWGMGGLVRKGGETTEAFALPLSDGVLVLAKFNAQRGVPDFNTLWEGLALLVAFSRIPSVAALHSLRSDLQGQV